MLKFVYFFVGVWVSCWWYTYGSVYFFSLPFDAQVSYFIPLIVILISEFLPCIIMRVKQHIAQKDRSQSDGSYVDE